jgi:predicted dehydrogenase
VNKVHWGILSTADIGLQRVIPAMQRGDYASIDMIASRNLEKAKAAAARLGIPRALGSYEELLADPTVEAIYNPLPNHLHVPWSIKALQAGKHVLCEKPIAMTSVEAQLLADAAHEHPRLKVMEAFMYRFHPQWQRAKQLVNAGAIGLVRTIQSFFSFYNVDPNNIRNIATIGGGVMMDLGCYNTSMSRFIFEHEPQRICAIVDYDPTFKTDRLVSAILDFGSGTSTFTCSTQLQPYQRINIVGSEGRIEIEIPINSPPDRPSRLWHQHGTEIEEIVLPPANQYTLQGDAFSRAILDDTPVPTPIEDAVANMQVIECLFQSAKNGGWFDCGMSPATSKPVASKGERP